MSYKIEFDGVATAELQKLLHSVENRVNGLGLYVQASETGASTVANGASPAPCVNGQVCSDSAKGGHYFAVAVIAIVVGAAAGYVAGKKAAQRVIESAKGGHV